MSFLYIFSFLFVCSSGNQKLFFAKFFVESVGNVKQVSNKKNQNFKVSYFLVWTFSMKWFLDSWLYENRPTNFISLIRNSNYYNYSSPSIRSHFQAISGHFWGLPFTLSERRVFKIFHFSVFKQRDFFMLNKIRIESEILASKVDLIIWLWRPIPKKWEETRGFMFWRFLSWDIGLNQ